MKTKSIPIQPRQPRNGVHGPLTTDPLASIERTVTIRGRKIQTQYLILSALTISLAASLLLTKEQTNNETSGQVD